MNSRAVVVAAVVVVGAAPSTDGASAQHGIDAARQGPSETAQVFIRFEPRAGSQVVSCAQPILDLGTTRSTARIRDFRMYVSDFRLVTTEGDEVPVTLHDDGPWTNGEVVLLDFEDGTGSCSNGTPPTNDVVRGTVPVGEYRGLRFVIGVPFAWNHADPTMARSPLDLTAMFWNWNAGYKFIRLDMETTGQPQGYAFHLGSTHCRPGDSPVTAATSCLHPNRVQVSLEGFDISRDRVVIDLATLFATTNVDIRGERFAGCMSGRTAQCDGLLGSLGLFGDGPQKLVRREVVAP